MRMLPLRLRQLQAVHCVSQQDGACDRFFETHHLDRSDASILRHCEHLFKQSFPNPDTLPLGLDRKRSLGCCWP